MRLKRVLLVAASLGAAVPILMIVSRRMMVFTGFIPNLTISAYIGFLEFMGWPSGIPLAFDGNDEASWGYFITLFISVVVNMFLYYIIAKLLWWSHNRRWVLTLFAAVLVGYWGFLLYVLAIV
jgi:hypothetical protein